MKKIFVIIACAMLSFNAANAQNLLNQLASAAQSSLKNTGSNTLSSLANVITSKLVPTTTQIVGTWSYEKPAVMFTSSNALKSAAASLASSSIENKLQSKYLSKIGITKGKMSITFNEDKTFTINRSNKKVASGTYTINGSDVSLTFKGRTNPCKFTPQLSNGSLCLVTDATKLKTFLENAGSKVSGLSTITSLTKGMTGMKLGLRLSK